MNTQQIKDALKNKYSGNEWVLLFEVRNTTGYSHQERYADAIAMNMWPSRGLDVIGFEIKASRGDWLSELKKPEKSAPIIKYCDYFYVVTGDKNIVQEGELPSNWGLIIPWGKGLKIKVKAPELKPEPLDRNFVASMLRRAQEQLSDRTKIREEVNRKLEKELKNINNSRKKNIENLQYQLSRIRKAVMEFQNKTGINIYVPHGYEDITKQIELIRFLRYGNIDSIIKRMKRMKDETEDIVERMNMLIEEHQNQSIVSRFPRPVERIPR